MPVNQNIAQAYKILQQHSKVPFVDRVLNKSKYPMLKEGDYDVTHKMAYAQVGDKYIVFPTVVYQDGKLIDLEKQGIDAVAYALKNKNFIEFTNPLEAHWFSQHYKDVWEMEE